MALYYAACGAASANLQSSRPSMLWICCLGGLGLGLTEDQPLFVELGRGRCLDASGREPRMRCSWSPASLGKWDDCTCPDHRSRCQAFAKTTRGVPQCLLYGEEPLPEHSNLAGWNCRGVAGQDPSKVLPVVRSSGDSRWRCFVKAEACRPGDNFNLTASRISCFARFHAAFHSPLDLADVTDALMSNRFLHPVSEEPLNFSKFSLRHDTEVLHHLAAKDLIPKLYEAAPAAFAAILDRLPGQLSPDVMFSLKTGAFQDAGHRRVFQALAHRSVHIAPGLRTEEPLLASPDAAAHAAEEVAYRQNAAQGTSSMNDGWVVVDNVLHPKALALIREVIEDSAIFFNSHHGGRYLQAGPDAGLYQPVFKQLAEELREAFPRILGAHDLVDYWAFKFDNTEAGQGGVGLHHDDAAVNANLWLVPGEEISANESANEVNGLLIYPVEVPGNDRTDEHTEKGKAVRRMLSKHRPRISVPYRANRLTLFKSSYLHESMDLATRPGYRNRRINLTFLFGVGCSGENKPRTAYEQVSSVVDTRPEL